MFFYCFFIFQWYYYFMTDKGALNNGKYNQRSIIPFALRIFSVELDVFLSLYC